MGSQKPQLYCIITHMQTTSKSKPTAHQELKLNDLKDPAGYLDPTWSQLRGPLVTRVPVGEQKTNYLRPFIAIVIFAPARSASKPLDSMKNTQPSMVHFAQSQIRLCRWKGQKRRPQMLAAQIARWDCPTKYIPTSDAEVAAPAL